MSNPFSPEEYIKLQRRVISLELVAESNSKSVAELLPFIRDQYTLLSEAKSELARQRLLIDELYEILRVFNDKLAH